RERVMKKYVRGRSEEVLGVIREARGVVTGPAALAFVLDDLSVLDNDLDIAIPKGSFYSVNEYLSNDVCAQAVRTEHLGTHPTSPSQRIYCLGRRQYIRLIISITTSALDAVAYYSTTALMNYFNDDSYGCAYPSLTLRCRALCGPWKLQGGRLPPDTTRFLRLNLLGGVLFSTVPAPFFGLKLTIFRHGGLEKIFYTCCREYDACPEQGRYFGDQGSFLGFFHPYGSPEIEDAREERRPPFGSTIRWWLTWTPYWCHSQCAIRETMIP
ncbi:hypothetical protein C8Q80DRAFT_1072939, partial [Daedaleopsis nitida]